MEKVIKKIENPALRGYIGRESEIRYSQKGKKTISERILGEKVEIDLENKTHTFIVGQTGSGKSYLAGVIAEEIAQRNPDCATVIIDITGAFRLFDKKNTDTEVGAWNACLGYEDIIPTPIKCNVYTPSDNFFITPSALTLDTMCTAFDLDPLESPQANLYAKTYERLNTYGYGYYSLPMFKDYMFNIYKDDNFKESTYDSLRNKIDAIDRLNFIDPHGYKIEEICKEGEISIINLNKCDRYVSEIIVSFIAEALTKRRRLINDDRINSELGIPPISKESEFIPTTFFILDEAHRFFHNNKYLKEIMQEGRGFGVIMNAISQRMNLSKELYSGVRNLFVGKCIYAEDINNIQSMLPVSKKPEHFRNEIRALKEGEFHFYDNKEGTENKILVRPRKTKHPAGTKIINEREILFPKKKKIQNISKYMEIYNDLFITKIPFSKFAQTKFTFLSKDTVCSIDKMYEIKTPAFEGKIKCVNVIKKNIADVNIMLLKRDIEEPFQNIENKKEIMDKLSLYNLISENKEIFVNMVEWVEKKQIEFIVC